MIPVPTVPAAVATTIVTCVVPVAGLRAVAGVGVVLGGRLGGVVAVAGVSPGGGGGLAGGVVGVVCVRVSHRFTSLCLALV